MARSIKAHEFVRAALRARARQEAVLKLMQAVQRLGELVNDEAARANEAAAASLGNYGIPASFVLVDGQTYAVNRHGIAPVNVEVL